MRAPSEHHLQAIKRILRYIKGTLHFGLKITPSTTFNISTFSDADWAGYLDTSQSTSGYAIILSDKSSFVDL
jgi:hypothetical protein